MAVQNHKKPEQKKTANNPPAGYTYSRQATFPPRQAKTSAKKADNRNAKKTKTEKQKRKRKNPERIRPQVAKQTYAPISPYKNGRRGDRTATAESTESGKATEKAKRKKSQKAKRKKRPAYGTQSPVKFSAGRGVQTYGSADHRDHTDPADHTSHAGRTGHETRTCHTEHKARTDHTGLPDHARPCEPRGKIPGVFCREGGIFH